MLDADNVLQREAKNKNLMSQVDLLIGKIQKSDISDIDRQIVAEFNHHLLILDDDGELLARTEDYPSALKFSHEDIIAIAMQNKAKELHEQYNDERDKNILYTAQAVYSDALLAAYIYVETPLEALQFDLNKIKRLVIILGAFFSWLMFLFVFIIIRRIAKEVGHLSSQANVIAKGNYSQRVESNYPHQTENLTGAINAIAANSEERIHQISLERNQLSVILSSLVEGVVALDEHQMVLHINEAAGQLLNITPNHLVGKAFLSAVRHPDVLSVVDSAFANKHEAKGQLELNSLIGNKVIDLHAVTFSMPQTQSQGVILVLHDVSMRKQLENIRRDFVANASHELKTPITAIKGLIETMRDDDNMPSAIRQRFTEKIYIQTQRLSDLTVQLMDLSRIELNVAEQKLDSFDLMEVCRELVNHYMHGLTENLSIAFNDNDESLILFAQRRDIEQIISNLLDNAIKYSSQGVIFLRVWREDINAMIQVEDSGIGISEPDLLRVFERFYRADKAHSSEIQGNGLGLSLVKNIVENNAGTITVSSEIDKGSCFTVALPLLNHR